MIQSNHSTRNASLGFTRPLHRAGNSRAKNAATPKIKIRFAETGATLAFGKIEI
jgi:hypothetical protein